MRRCKCGSGIGFTLAELIIVAVILSILGVAVYTAFSNGIKLWKRINEEVPQEDINIFFAKISRDLRNLSRCSGIEFSGEPDSVSFPTIVVSEADEGVRKIIGLVKYAFDKEEKSVMSEQSDYSGLYQSEPGRTRTLVSRIDSLSFQYYCHDPDTEEYLWLKAWNKYEAPPDVKTENSLPLAVKVEIEPNGGNEGEKFTRVVTLPIGG